MIGKRSVLFMAAAVMLGITPAAADDFPSRPVKLLVPYAAGGGTDTIARLVAQGVTERLGQQMVVENNGAAGGNIATTQAAAAAPDGYTVLMANQGPMVVNPHLFKNLKVDPLTAFEPLTLITAAPLIFVVPKTSKYTSVKEIMDYGKANPGKLTYGSAGSGSASHLATVLLGTVAKVDMVHVPYRGAGPALTDLVGGRVDFMVTTVPSVLGLMEGGEVKALGLTSKERAKRFPDLPAIAEVFPGYEATAWYGFAVPKGTPEPVKTKLRDATIAAIKGGEIKNRLEAEGAEPIGNTPAEFGAMMASESKRWAEIVKQANLKVE